MQGGGSWPIAAPKRGPIREEDVNFDDLLKDAKKPTHIARESSIWITEATCRLVYQRTSLRQRHPVDQHELRTAKSQFQA